jgi:transposase-like protein
MDPQGVFCPNPACPARGQANQGNIGVHSQKEQRFLCKQCGKTFAARKDTPFYRLRESQEVVTVVVTLLAHGCPLQAIVAAFGLDERTVAQWQRRAGQHCQRLHEHLVQTPRDLGQVQADEIRVKMQKEKGGYGGVVWMALALMVRTRLWLGGEVSCHRDTTLITRLVERVRRCAHPTSPRKTPLLFCTDGLCTYLSAIRKVFRDPVPSEAPRAAVGRPRLQAWKGLLIAQVVKRYQQRRVVEVEHRVKQGSPQRVQRVIATSQGQGVINTAFMERLNATFRERLAPLVRRSRALARHTQTLQHGMFLVGTVYNFCTCHSSLAVATAEPAARVRRCTPAMAAGITDHAWSVAELLSYHVPLPQWTPPKRRGRISQAMKLTIERWCS